MRGAEKTTLQALYDGKLMTANNSIEYGTTRITNEISRLRNTFDIAIEMKRNNTTNNKWYGSYHLIRNEKNLEKVRDILGILPKKDEVQKSHD